MKRIYTHNGKPITKAENDRLNREYLAYVNWSKHGTIAMNNHGFEFGKEPPYLTLGAAADPLINIKITYTLNKITRTF